MKTLLGLLSDSLGDNTDFWGGYDRGICAHIRKLHTAESLISDTEYRKLELYVDSKRPTKFVHPEFLHPTNRRNEAYWWPVMSIDIKYREIRIEFIEKLISELK